MALIGWDSYPIFLTLVFYRKGEEFNFEPGKGEDIDVRQDQLTVETFSPPASS